MSISVIRAKAQRLNYLYSLLMNHPKGMTTRELALRSNVNQRTIQRDLLDLQDEPFRVPFVQEGNRWRVMVGSSYILPPIQFELQEATALFLASRLLCRYADETLPCLNKGLEKLASILPQPIGDHVHRSARMLTEKPTNLTFNNVFSTITQAWATRRCVRIVYYSAGSEETRETMLSPYFIEPSGIGYATYVIGYASHAGEMRTFKIERIVEADLSDETFVVPVDFDAPQLLESAWGIKYGEELHLVTLLFSPAVARRLNESVWHSSQSLEMLEDGSCRLSVRVAHPDEMRPWIRGWGADCRVEEPAWLREEIAQELQRAASQYVDDSSVGGDESLQ